MVSISAVETLLEEQQYVSPCPFEVFFQEEVLLLAEGGMAVNCLRECGA
jgi:hypothetical protein